MSNLMFLGIVFLGAFVILGIIFTCVRIHDGNPSWKDYDKDFAKKFPMPPRDYHISEDVKQEIINYKQQSHE